MTGELIQFPGAAEREARLYARKSRSSTAEKTQQNLPRLLNMFGIVCGHDNVSGDGTRWPIPRLIFTYEESLENPICVVVNPHPTEMKSIVEVRVSSNFEVPVERALPEWRHLQPEIAPQLYAATLGIIVNRQAHYGGHLPVRVDYNKAIWNKTANMDAYRAYPHRFAAMMVSKFFEIKDSSVYLWGCMDSTLYAHEAAFVNPLDEQAIGPTFGAIEV